jgi:hypothetical protein
MTRMVYRFCYYLSIYLYYLRFYRLSNPFSLRILRESEVFTGSGNLHETAGAITAW